MNGILCKPEKLEEALRDEGLYSDILQGSINPLSWDRKQSFFYEIMESDKSEEEKLNSLLEKDFISKREYKLLKKCISKDETIPRRIFISYPREFFDKHFGPITLKEAIFAFCEDPRAIPEFKERVNDVGCVYDGILDELYGLGFVNPHEYRLVLKNIGRKNGTNIS